MPTFHEIRQYDADLDPLLRHDERAVHQREIADEQRPVLAERKRAAGVTGNVIAEPDRSRRSWLRRKRKICAVSQ